MLIKRMKTRRGKVAVAVLTFLLVVAWVVVSDAFFDSIEESEEPTPAKSVSFTVKAQTMGRSAPINLADPKMFWTRYESYKIAEKFKRGRLGESYRGTPTKVKDAMNRWYKAHGAPRIRIWWRNSAVTQFECMYHFQISNLALPTLAQMGAAFCTKWGRDVTVRRINRRLTHLKVVCGGAGMIGLMGGGALAGMGAGAAACVYSHYSDRFMNLAY